MRRVTLVILAGWLVVSLELSYAISDEPRGVQHLTDRPDLRRDRTDKNADVFRLLTTWRKSDVDPQQDTKANQGQPFRLLTMRDKPETEIRPAADERPSTDHDPAETEAKIYRSLNKRISADFQDAPLIDVIKRLASRCDVNFFIDPRGLEDAGVTSAAKVTITAHGVRLCTVLDQILLPLHLDYIVAHEVIKVTGRQQAKGELTARTYPIAGLVAPLEDGRAAPDRAVVDAWIEKLREQICPSTWEEAGGPGSVIFYATTVSIVVRQTADVHEELELYLESLEDEESSADDDDDQK